MTTDEIAALTPGKLIARVNNLHGTVTVYRLVERGWHEHWSGTRQPGWTLRRVVPAGDVEEELEMNMGYPTWRSEPAAAFAERLNSLNGELERVRKEVAQYESLRDQ